MKKVLLLAILVQSINASAQSFEFGIGGGFSSNGTPNGNLLYKQDQSLLNYAATLKLLYTTPSGWQFGLDGHLHELSGKSNKKYQGFVTDTVGGDNKKLVYAKYMSSLSLVANKYFSFTPKENLPRNSGVYIGVALGYGAARNMGGNYKANESYKAPDGGHGMALGLQAGYLGYLSESLSFNFEVAFRHYTLKYDAGAPLVLPAEKLNYSIIAFPVTAGIRYYFYRVPSNIVPRSGGVRPMGRSSR